jgi:hypothetical protein
VSEFPLSACALQLDLAIRFPESKCSDGIKFRISVVRIMFTIPIEIVQLF